MCQNTRINNHLTDMANNISDVGMSRVYEWTMEDSWTVERGTKMEYVF